MIHNLAFTDLIKNGEYGEQFMTKQVGIIIGISSAILVLVLIIIGINIAGQFNALQAANRNLSDLSVQSANKILDLQSEIESLEAELSNKLTNMSAEISNLEATHKQLEEGLKAELKSGEIEIQKIRGVLTLNIADRLFFDSGKADIKPEGEKILVKVAGILTNIPEKMVKIEGHTDNIPISEGLTNRFASNWELSVARATTVVRFLQEKGNISADRLSVSGYAEFRPIASNKTAKGRAKNRRIEIVLADRQLYQIMEMKKGVISSK